jgi:hypothetical protein
MTLLTLASQPWRPFIDPLPIAGVADWVWYLALPPLVFGIAAVYKAVRIWDMDRYWPQVIKLFLAIVLGCVTLAVLFSLLAGLILG